MKTGRFLRLVMWVSLVGLFAAVCVLAAVAIWLAGRAVAGQEVARGEPLLNHIAFVGNDGNLWLVAPDGEQAQLVTTDGKGYHFPTWSRDGRRLAFIGPAEQGGAALYAFDDVLGETSLLFDGPDSAPFYIYWSPDSRTVTFLTQEASSLALRLADAANPGDGRLMAEGAPFYWVWSPEGHRLLMHVGGARSSSNAAHLSFLDNEEGAPRVELELAPGRFQAPIWSNDGQHIYYITANRDGAETLHKADVDTAVQTLVTHLKGSTSMVLSPDDRHVAYLHLKSAGSATALGTAYIVGTDGENERTVLEDWVAALYWSPDGTKLALLTSVQGGDEPTARVHGLAAPAAANGSFRWWLYDVNSAELELLTSFVATQDFLQTVPFFDQYHLSLTFWSPDSRYFVLTRRDATGGNGTVWVIDTRGQNAPRQIGEGTFAVWSWQ